MYSAVLAIADPTAHPWWQWASPLLAALVSGTLVAWIQHPRPRLRMTVGALTVEDQERLWRANKKKYNWHGLALHPDFVRLTNYGNGTAFDIQLDGDHCMPRVWIGDAPTSTGGIEGADPPPEIGVPMWDNTLSSLGPGESVTIFVMREATNTPLSRQPELTVTWPRLANWGIWRKRLRITAAEATRVEMGWPGSRDNTRR